MDMILCLNCDTEKSRTSFVIRTGKVRKVCHQCYDDLANAGKRCCSKCNEVKPLDELHYNVKNRKEIYTGADPIYYAWCKECNKRRGQKWYNANAEKISQKRFDNQEFYKEKDRIYYQKVKDTVRKEYYEQNKERISEHNTEYWKENREDRLEVQRKRRAKPEEKRKIADYVKKRRDENPLVALSHNIRVRVTEAFSRGNYLKRSKTQAYLGMSYPEVKEYLESLFDEDMTWENYGEWHVDHIIPLSSAETEAEMLALAYYKNLQPLWAVENLSKNDDYDPKDKEEYLEWYSKNVAQK